MNYLIKKNFYVVISVIFVCSCILSKFANAGDPELIYKTITTDHFYIHYSQGLEHLARRTASISEEVYSKITTDLGWKVKTKVNIRIKDSSDSANGMAMPSPYPLIELYATPPDLESSLQNNDNWLYTLLTHEFTHIVHLQMQHGIAKMVNHIFGDVYLPNAMLPTWFIEGLAVMMETHKTSRGRIRSVYYDMVLRTHALEGTFQSLGEASNSTVQYPRGSADYIYGAMFMEYLSHRFGEKKIFEVCHIYASKPVPYFINTAFKQATGESLWKVYKEWAKSIKQKALQTKKKIKKQGLSTDYRVTVTAETKGRAKFFPPISGFKDKLIIPASDAVERSGLYITDINTRKMTRIALGNSKGSISLTDKGDIYYVRSAPYRNIYHYRDLFIIKHPVNKPYTIKNLIHSKPIRLTHGMRIKEAAVSPDGSMVAAVTAKNGITGLIICNGDCSKKKKIIKGSDSIYIYHPVFSSDSRLLAAVVRDGAMLNLALINKQNGKINYLTKDDAKQRSPIFSPDGKYLLFDSDVTGISNIFAIELKTKKCFQVTNVVTGAKFPAISSDGQSIVFLKYKTKGWDLYKMPWKPLSYDEFKQPESRYKGLSPVKEPASFRGNTSLYNPFPSLIPRTWMLGYSQGGGQKLLTVQSSIQDAAELHLFDAGFTYEFAENMPSFAFSYGYYGLLPSFHISFGYLTRSIEKGYLVEGESLPWKQRRLSGDFGFSLGLPGLDERQSIYFGYNLVFSEPVDDLDITSDPALSLPKSPTQFFRAGLKIGWGYSNIFSSPFAISREKGRTLYTTIRIYHPSFGGDQELMSLRWGWNEYILMPWLSHHVIALSLNGGINLSNPKGITYFRAGGYGPQNILSDIINNTSSGLPKIRGYETDSIAGDHFHSLRLEYRFPIWRAELAGGTVPLFFKEVHGGIFSDNILMSFNPVTFDDLYSAVGAELIWSFYLAYHMPVTLRVGYARGLMDNGINEFLFVMGNTF